MKKKKEDFYTPKELAGIFRVHYNTIYHAIKTGRIQAFKVGGGKKAPWRIFKSEIERMAAFDAEEMINKIVYRRMRGIK